MSGDMIAYLQECQDHLRLCPAPQKRLWHPCMHSHTKAKSYRHLHKYTNLCIYALQVACCSLYSQTMYSRFNWCCCTWLPTCPEDFAGSKTARKGQIHTATSITKLWSTLHLAVLQCQMAAPQTKKFGTCLCHELSVQRALCCLKAVQLWISRASYCSFGCKIDMMLHHIGSWPAQLGQLLAKLLHALTAANSNMFDIEV